MSHEPRRRGNSMAETPYWDEKPLEALTPAEWESLCDGCGRCCLVKLEDEDTGRIYFTEIACRLLDVTTCRCSDYAHRRRKVRDCLKLTPDLATSLAWLPPTCAYRLRAEGRRLAWWHPLVSGSPETVHEAGISVRGRVSLTETDLKIDDYAGHIVSWPGKSPRGARARPVPGTAAKSAPGKSTRKATGGRL
jgi:uncharacterized cysteine cluster protein YcgN (CxxCxxCC family)